jgi:hypothetical protein
MKVLEYLQWLLLPMAFAAGAFERPRSDGAAASMIWKFHLERLALEKPWAYAAALSGGRVAIIEQS